VLEGLALQADPSFKVGRGASGRQPGGEGRRAAVGGRRRADPLPLPLQLLGATWPFLSKRLLTDPDPALRDGVKAFSDWPTIPQVYVAGEFVGGADILMAMHQSGELAKALGVDMDGKGGDGA
jgi:hypothetical protein